MNLDLNLMVGVASKEKVVLTSFQVIDYEQVVVALSVLLLDNSNFLKPVLDDNAVLASDKGHLTPV